MAPTWYDDFVDNGYTVIPSVITPAKAVEYQQAAFNWLRSFDNHQLDFSDPMTWTTSNLPHVSQINTFNHYGVVHERFMWEIRLEERIIETFAQLWNTDELLVSFDALNIMLPRRPGHVPRVKWPHVDQSPFRQGLQYVQGIVNLSKTGPEDGGLTVYPGSHKVVEEFFAQHTDPMEWDHKDFYSFTADQMTWFEETQDCKSHKVIAEAGDLIIWDSRLVHYGAEPNGNSDTIRTVTYVSYAPVQLASAVVLEKKREAFDKWLATTHWPHENIVLRPNLPVLPSGLVDTRRNEPRDKPELTDKLLKLAGVKSYS